MYCNGVSMFCCVVYRDEEGRTALHIASSFGHMESVEWLLKRRGVVKQTNAVDTESKWSSLHRAAYYGYPNVIIALLKVLLNEI